MLYDLTDEDHIPVTVHVNFELLPSLTNENNGSNFKINWDAATEIDLKKFLKLTDEKFSQIELPVEALCCTNLNCIDQSHINMINNFYENIISILNESSTHLSSKYKASWNKPGWSEYVADLYDYFREISKLWIENGKPRQGFLFREYLKSKARYKYALRYIKRNENLLRKESLAKKLSNLNSNEFWKEIKSISNSKTPLPCSIDNANNPEEILNLWEKHFNNIFNCLDRVLFNNNYNLETNLEII